jgi:hypothetical protein
MKTRTTLVMALLAGGLFAYIWFVERHRETTRDAAESSARVVSIERDAVESLSLTNGPSRIELRKKDGVWQMEQPIQDRADTSAIERLISLVSALRHDAKIDLPKGKEQETLKEFGLADSETSLVLRAAGGKETQLLLGKDSAVAGKLYVRKKDQNSAFVIRSELRDRITAGADEYRDHRLSAASSAAVEKFTVKSGEAEITLERKSGAWELVKPIRARASTAKVNDLLAGMLTAPVSQFLAEAPSPEQGLAEPRATISLVLEGQKEPLVLQLGATPSGDQNKDRTFAKCSERNAVVVLSNVPLDPLIKARPNDLRDRKLVRVESDIVDRITFEPRGRPPVVLMRKGEGWNYLDSEKEMPVKDGLASKILSELLAAEAVDFVADLTADPAKFGLVEPAWRVRLSSFASENTAESKSGENPIVTLLFGKMEGEACFVKLEEEPFIVTASPRLPDWFPMETYDLLPPPTPESVLAFKAAEVLAITVEGTDRAADSLQRVDGTWKASAGERTPDTGAVDALLARLEALKGGRITGRYARLEDALKTSILSLKIEAKTATGQAQHFLKVGALMKDGSHPATVEGKEGVFLLSAADVATLQVKLLP